VLRQGEREEGAVDAGGGRQAAGLHLHPWHRQLDQRAPESRSSFFLAWVALLMMRWPGGAGTDEGACMVAGLKRCGKSCRLRYTNYLRPNLKHENFTQEEEDLIVTLHAMLGSRYVHYSTLLQPGCFFFFLFDHLLCL
jgi:hypothetical protein